jgi:hypothetical protein
MPELTPSTREAARRLSVSDTTIHKAERAGRIAREPDGNWDIGKTRRRLTETADPNRSPLANGAGADGTPFARLFGTSRRIVDMVLPRSRVPASLDLGAVIRLTFPRVGLAAGKQFTVTALDEDWTASTVRIEGWG